MPSICLANPNSTPAMTEEMVEAARAVAAAGTTISGATVAGSPATIEGYRDEAVAAAGVVELVESSRDEVDAFVIACFGDPGLYAAKETCEQPVVGIAEASFMFAMAVGHRFAILTNTSGDVPEMEALVARYGLERRCSGVVPVELGVAEADADREAAFSGYHDAAGGAIAAGAEVLCLGCGPMLGLRARLEESTGAPVIEPVPAGIAIAESLLGLGLSTSKVGGFRPRDRGR